MAKRPDPGSPFSGFDDYTIADVTALQAVSRTPDGERALRCIVEKLAQTYQVSYRPQSDRDTAFAEGRRFVGLQIVKLLLPQTLQQLRDRHGRTGSKDPSRNPTAEQS